MAYFKLFQEQNITAESFLTQILLVSSYLQYLNALICPILREESIERDYMALLPNFPLWQSILLNSKIRNKNEDGISRKLSYTFQKYIFHQVNIFNASLCEEGLADRDYKFISKISSKSISDTLTTQKEYHARLINAESLAVIDKLQTRQYPHDSRESSRIGTQDVLTNLKVMD